MRIAMVQSGLILQHDEVKCDLLTKPAKEAHIIIVIHTHAQSASGRTMAGYRRHKRTQSAMLVTARKIGRDPR